VTNIVSNATIEGIISTGLKTADLTALIAREEAFLASDPTVGIGALTGARTDTVRPRDLGTPIELRRIPTSVTVTDGGVELAADAWELATATSLVRIANDAPVDWTGPRVTIEWTPDDLELVSAAVIDLVRLAITSSPYGQEATEGHSYSRPGAVLEMRRAIARSLDRSAGAATVHLTAR
jgi:hypothetical protein